MQGSLSWDDFAAKAKPGRVYKVGGELPHPSECGFVKTRAAWPKRGREKIGDWVKPYGRSRIHVHEFLGGELEAHVDKYDPRQAVVPHAMMETELGRALTFVVGTFVSVKLFDALRRR